MKNNEYQKFVKQISKDCKCDGVFATFQLKPNILS